MSINYRKINSLFTKRVRKYIKKSHLAFHLRNFFLIVFVVTALLQIQILVNLGLKHGQFLKTKEIREREYEYWSSVANQFPNVPDILYNAGVASINVGKKEKALGFLDKALRLDPLFIEAQQLRNNLFN